MSERFETREVLAAAYPKYIHDAGGPYLTHTVRIPGYVPLCKRVKVDHIADAGSMEDGGAAKPPTCPVCLKRDPRFSSTVRSRLIREAMKDVGVKMYNFFYDDENPATTVQMRESRARELRAAESQLRVLAGYAARNDGSPELRRILDALLSEKTDAR